MENLEIKELFEDFCRYMKSTLGNAESTIKAYRTDFNTIYNILKKEVIKKEKIKIKDIKAYDIQRVIQYLSFEKKNKNVTIARKISFLHSFYEYLEIFDLIDKNIMRKIKSPKLRSKKAKEIKDEYIEKFFKTLLERKYKNDFNKLSYLLFFHFKYGTCARTIEMTRIRIKDINFKERYVLLKGKGNKERYIPITKKACLLALKFIKVAKLKEDDLLIRNKDNKPISRRSLMWREKQIREEAGIPDWIKLHPLTRKKPATEIYLKYKDIVMVQDILGHEDPKTTRLYVANMENKTLRDFKKSHPLD